MARQQETEIPVYVFMGFLDSGKTTFVKETLLDREFTGGAKTLLLVCEDGEEEYDEKDLKKKNIFLEFIEEDQLNTEHLLDLQDKYQPEQVMIEYNGMWKLDKIFDIRVPKGWTVVQVLSFVNAETYDVYQQNMKATMMDQVNSADMVVFNRCKEGDPLPAYRRGIKVANQSAEVIFENEEGEIDDIFQDEMPYDMNADIIDIEDIDYGIWYVDMMDNLDKYVDKTVRFKGQVLKSRELNAGFFVPGRMAMTCCADDTQFIGYICKNCLLYTSPSPRDCS